MRINYIATIRFPTERAHGLAIAKICSALAQEGAKVELIVPKRVQSCQLEKIKWEKFYAIKKGFKVKRLACIDLLWVSWYASKWTQSLGFLLLTLSFYTSLFFYLLKNFKTKIIYTREILITPLLLLLGKKVFLEIHNWPSSKRIVWFYSLFLKRTTGVIAISASLAERIKNLGIYEKNILISPSAVDKEFFQKIKKDVARKKLRLPPNKKIIVYAGSLTKEKGIDVLLQTIKILGDNKNIFFLIIGSTFKVGGDSDINIKIKALKNASYLGYQPYRKIPLFLASADVLVLPNSVKVKGKIYREYTSPMKLYEYMASEKPIIASKILAIANILKDKKNVLFFKPDDAKDLGEKILALLQNQSLAGEMGKQARKLASQYTWHKRAKKILGFISKYVRD